MRGACLATGGVHALDIRHPLEILARCQPVDRRTLRVEIHQGGLEALVGIPGGQIGRDRGLATTAFGVHAEDGLHRIPLDSAVGYAAALQTRWAQAAS